jgi:hypothetical protein
MADEITISDLPRYGEVMAQHKVRLAEAEAAGDENAIKAVRLDWDRERFNLEREAVEVQGKKRQLDEARARIKEQYPNTPDSLLTVTDDPAKLEELAKETHEKMQVPAATGAGWGKGAPTASGGSGGAPATITADEYAAQKMAEAKHGMNPEAVRDANRVIFADKIGTRFGKFEETA